MYTSRNLYWPSQRRMCEDGVLKHFLIKLQKGRKSKLQYDSLRCRSGILHLDSTYDGKYTTNNEEREMSKGGARYTTVHADCQQTKKHTLLVIPPRQHQREFSFETFPAMSLQTLVFGDTWTRRVFRPTPRGRLSTPPVPVVHYTFD